MLEFLGILAAFILGIVTGRSVVMQILTKEKENRYVQYKGKVYRYTFEEENDKNIIK